MYDDDGTKGVVSAAERPLPLWLKYFEPLLYGGLYGGILLLDSAGPSSETSQLSNEFERVKELHDELVEHLKASLVERGASAPEPPPSGEYWGASEESDEGDQAVRTTLRFKLNGVLSGHGKDGVDGTYRISKGAWGIEEGERGGGKITVGWIEVYD